MATDSPTPLMMSQAADQAAIPTPEVVPSKLAQTESDDYRSKARQLWEDITGYGAFWKPWSSYIHHRIPLEWADLFPRANPNRLANLVAVDKSTYDSISLLWTKFRTTYKNPTPAQVLKEAMRIDDPYGGMMHFIDEWPPQ